MARAYSKDLRERVIEAIKSGQSCRSAAARFGVSASTAIRWAQRLHQTGNFAAMPTGGRASMSLVGEKEWILQRLAEKPDLTLHEILASLKERGVKASYGALWRLLASEKISYKKKRSAC